MKLQKFKCNYPDNLQHSIILILLTGRSGSFVAEKYFPLQAIFFRNLLCMHNNFY